MIDVFFCLQFLVFGDLCDSSLPFDVRKMMLESVLPLTLQKDVGAASMNISISCAKVISRDFGHGTQEFS